MTPSSDFRPNVPSDESTQQADPSASVDRGLSSRGLPYEAPRIEAMGSWLTHFAQGAISSVVLAN